jgi:hypothetical protein
MQCKTGVERNRSRSLRSAAAAVPRGVISSHDGELIDELLDPAIVPTALLINPPYSVGLERGNDGLTGARHLRSALNRLAAGGRAVAIMPEWFDAHAFLQRSQMQLALRLNLALPRAFLSSGTSIATRIIVIDKVGPTSPPVIGTAADLAEALNIVDSLPPRSSRRACPDV